MPRPKTKEALIALSQMNYDKLLAFIKELPEEKRNSEFPSRYLNRNIRDVLAHLHHWHLLFLSWYQQGMNGEKPEMPASGYTWRSVPELNIEINEKYKNVPMSKVFMLFDSSFKEVQRLIAKHTDRELFEKRKY